MYGPRGVAEEALDLADDVGDGEGGELVLEGDVEAVDGLDQADRADLHDVVHLLGAAAEAARGVAHQRQVHLDERVARVLVVGGAFLQLPQPLEEQLREPACVLGCDAVRLLDRGQAPCRRGVLDLCPVRSPQILRCCRRHVLPLPALAPCGRRLRAHSSSRPRAPSPQGTHSLGT